MSQSVLVNFCLFITSQEDLNCKPNYSPNLLLYCYLCSEVLAINDHYANMGEVRIHHAILEMFNAALCMLWLLVNEYHFSSAFSGIK